MSKLHSSVKVGPYEFSHRVVLAPLTRMRAEESARPGPLMAEYYAQRTSKGGLLIGKLPLRHPTAMATWVRPACTTTVRLPAGNS